MNTKFPIRGRRSRGHSALALAIAAGISSLAALPATAATFDSLEQHAAKAAVANAFRMTRPQVERSATFVLPQDAFSRTWQAVTPDNPGDPASWADEEFQGDWGLAAINAQHAYARGLSGAGIRLGLLDSGVSFADHYEFAGKDHRGLEMADLLEDGSRCSSTTVLAGPDACFYSRGDQSAIIAEWWDPELQDHFPNPANDYLWDNTFLYFNTHGMHVAGTIAANRDGDGMHGVAFGADLSAARLFNDSLTVVDLDCIFLNDCLELGTSASASAFEHMYDQAIAQGVRAMNHSWGYTYYAYTPEVAEAYHDLLMADPRIGAIHQAIADASLQSGMIQVFSAGNTNVIIPTPAQSPEPTLPATLPAIIPEIEQYWVSVVNLNENLTLSNRSMKCGISAQWCIAAPGTNILSTVLDERGNEDGDWLGDWEFDEAGNLHLVTGDRTGDPAYELNSGTSMAAPHVTGALGLLFERFPYLTGAQVRDVMLTTATDLGEEGVDEIYGWGLLNLEKAIEGYGLLRVDTNVVMDVAAGGNKVWQGGAWDDWTNDIGGPGRLTKSGAGWLRLSGDNSFAGATVTSGILEFDGDNSLTGDVRVEGGTLVVNGSFTGSPLDVLGGVAVINGSFGGAPTFVGANGTIGGSGVLGDTRVEGTIAPGNSIGTLTIDGNYVQEANARFIAELLPPDQADLLRVTGTATLNGGTLVASNLSGNDYVLGQTYQILSAEGGITGGFAGIDGSAISPFLSLSLLQAANTVSIDVARGASLASAGTTANQRAAAAAVDGLADTNTLVLTATQLSLAEAPAAFDSLSGEVHASARQVLLEGSRLVRDAALDRAAGGGAFGRQAEGATGAWVQVQHQGGDFGGDGNAAEVRYNSDAVLVGVDHVFGGWRVGVFGGAGDSDFNVGERGSRGESSNRHAGIYVGNAWGALGLTAGYSQSWNRVEIDRKAGYRGFSDALSSRYDADTSQLFVDLGYRFDAGSIGIEPYLQYARVEVSTDSFSESGGAAALAGRGGDATVDMTTVGLRFGADLSAENQEQSWLNLRGNLGYRHADDQVQRAQLAFAGGQSFEVSSPAIRDNALLAEFGVAARTSANSLLELGVSHLESDDAVDTGVNARFTINF